MHIETHHSSLHAINAPRSQVAGFSSLQCSQLRVHALQELSHLSANVRGAVNPLPKIISTNCVCDAEDAHSIHRKALIVPAESGRQEKKRQLVQLAR